MIQVRCWLVDYYIKSKYYNYIPVSGFTAYASLRYNYTMYAHIANPLSLRECGCGCATLQLKVCAVLEISKARKGRIAHSFQSLTLSCCFFLAIPRTDKSITSHCLTWRWARSGQCYRLRMRRKTRLYTYTPGACRQRQTHILGKASLRTFPVATFSLSFCLFCTLP